MKPLRMVVALLSVAAAAASAEFPYPANPAPCGGASSVLPPRTPGTAASPCIEATDFGRYLFLPATEPPTLPPDFNDNWKLSSKRTGDPLIDGNPQELFGVTGAGVDLAWQVTTGRPDVVIAVLDSGIRWAEPLPDLENKFYLNARELPVPLGGTSSANSHDRNGDGVFNVRDYDDDPRVSDQNGNGRLDPEDLIFLFSDGVDDDANGYTDDISGWDFFEDDNDPLDEVRYGHGTGESHDSGAEASNGGDVGTCANCMLLEVRVGDSFIGDVNDFAQGVLFAVDSGARVIQEALGTLNHSTFGQQAIDYATRHGVPVIASAADEQSNHNNWPATYNHTIEVNSVTRAAGLGPIRQTPPSYLYLNGCTNFGGHIAVSVPSTSCSSEATGLSSGMAGLVISAALNEIDAGRLDPYSEDGSIALSANEVKQLLTLTADDIDFDARADTDPPLPQNYVTNLPVPGIRENTRFPSIGGWDQYFGYGRINADRAVRRVRAGEIPPEVAIEAPRWFAVLNTGMGTVPLRGYVAARRSNLYAYQVEVAPGVQPRESEFQAVTSVEGKTGDTRGIIAELDLASIATMLPHGTTGAPVQDDGSLRGDPERFAFTVRVRVRDANGRRAEDRRTLFLHDDPDLVGGAPMELGADGAASPVMADLDGDGQDDVIVATSDGEVHAFRLPPSGNPPLVAIPGWPVRSDPIEVHAESAAFTTGGIPVPRGAVMGSIAAGDLDRDGTLEVVAADLEGKVYVWNRDGSRRAGFPVSTLPEYSFYKRSERDPGTPEGRVPDRVNRHGRHNRLGRAILGGVTLGNLDGSTDGSLEILAVAFDRHVYAWRNDGTPVPGWPVLVKDPEKVADVDPVTNEVTLTMDAAAVMGTKIITPVSLGDLDGDGDLEVVVNVNEAYEEPPNVLFTNPLLNLLLGAGVVSPGNTRMHAIHHDGTLHGGGGIERGWNPAAFVDGWPVKVALLTTELLPVVGTGSNTSPALADVDVDGLPEIATMSVAGPVYLFRGDGTSALGTHDSGVPRTFAIEPFGAGSNTIDAPALGALGGVVLSELAGAGQGYHAIAATTGLGRLLDSNLPAKQFPSDNHLSAWTVSGGNLVEAFPRQVNDLQFFAAPTVADIDGDGLPEALQGSGVWELHAVDVNGKEPPGWPKFTGGWTVTSPAVGDLDGDGQLEVAAVTREGNLFLWRTAGDECGFQPWRRFHHDEWSTGNDATDARPPGRFALLPSDQIRDGAITFEMVAVPGDDLYCGETARLDLRFSKQPIASRGDFEAATPAEGIELDAEPSRSVSGPLVRVRDPRLAGGTFHFAAVARDDAGNRTELVQAGSVTIPGATPTPSASVSPTYTPLPCSRCTPAATSTPAFADDGGGCRVAAGGGGSAWPFGVIFVFLLRARRRRRVG